MENSLTYLANDLFLEQSEMFSDVYKDVRVKNGDTYNDISISNLNDWLNSIIMKYDFLNKMQIDNFISFLKSLDSILRNIDPKKLKINNDCIDEDDLQLWRESNSGISKLVFDKYGQIVYMFNGTDGRKIKGVFDNSVDMKKLLNRFIYS